jgi:hypothetical protein
MNRGARFQCAPLLALALACTASGCATNVPRYSASAVALETVFVVPGDVDAHPEYAGSSDFGVLFAEYLAGALQSHGISAFAVSRGATVPQSARFVLTGDILEMDSGSWNRRFWLGFGAGRASIRTRITLKDATRQVVSYTRIYKRGSITLHFEENIQRRILGRIAKSVATNLAARIQRTNSAVRLSLRD